MKEGIFPIGEEINQWKDRLLTFYKNKGGNKYQKSAPSKAYDECLEFFEGMGYVELVRDLEGNLNNRGKIIINESDFWGRVEKRENEVGEVVSSKFDPLYTYGPDEVKNGVYLVYFESYKKIDSDCKNFWRCKIGMTKEDLEIEIEALNARVKWAIEKLQEGSSLIEEELRSMKISYANVKAYEVWEKMEKEKKI